MTRFGHALKAPKAPQQLWKAAQPQSRSIGLRNCSKARFGQALQPPKPARSLRKPRTAQRPHKLFLLGFETFTWHVLGKAPEAVSIQLDLSVAIQLFCLHGRPHGALCLLWMRPDARADQTSVRQSGHLCACCFVPLLTTPFST